MIDKREFLRDLEALKKLKGIKNVVQLKSYGYNDKYYCMILPFIRGTHVYNYDALPHETKKEAERTAKIITDKITVPDFEYRNGHNVLYDKQNKVLTFIDPGTYLDKDDITNKKYLRNM